MKKIIFFILITSLTTITTPVMSGPFSNALGECMVDALNGKERKKLAQWIFFAMSVHPEIKKFSKVTPEKQDEIDRYIGQLITRLLSDDCETKAKVAIKKEGQQALGSSFEIVGRVAMEELMANKLVTSSITGYAKYLDKSKLADLMKSN